MNWIQFRSDQTPINLDNIVGFFKSTVDDYPYIQFITASGSTLTWDYNSPSIRDEDYRTLIGIIFHPEDN